VEIVERRTRRTEDSPLDGVASAVAARIAAL